MESWALKAIEDEAMARAMRRLFNDPEWARQQLRVLGLDFRQILYLRDEWRKAHGDAPVPYL